MSDRMRRKGTNEDNRNQEEGGRVGNLLTTVVTPFREMAGQLEYTGEPILRQFRHYNDQPQFYTHAFSHKSNAWTPVSYQTLNRKFNGHQISSLRVLTYNIWFHEDENFDARCDAIIKILKDSRAAVIGLQEVIPRFLKKLVAREWVKENYYITDVTGNSFCGYGNIIMSLLRPSGFFARPLESVMGRQLIMGEFIINNPHSKMLEILRVGVVHMESMKGSAEMRKDQFRQIFPMLTRDVAGYKYVHSILMGDFNLDPNSPEETDSVRAVLGNDFIDCWKECHPAESGETRFVNYPEGNEPVRYDRILLWTKKNRFIPQRISTFGATAIDVTSGNESYDTVYPSDHLGLVCDFEVRYKPSSRIHSPPAQEKQHG